DNAERGVTMAAFTPIPRPAGVRGNPGPFGLLCYASLQGFIPVVMSYAMFFGGAGQLIAGILEGNTFAGTAFSSYGCFWMGWFLFNYFAVSKITPSVLAVALTGDTLWCGLWGVLTFLFYIVTRKNGCLQTIFLTLWITFFLLAGGQLQCPVQGGCRLCGLLLRLLSHLRRHCHAVPRRLGWTLPGMRPTNFI
ncbi:GPR1/FUN34/yaaH family-domain-containing protein, partial [Haematococcus lacustris]